MKLNNCLNKRVFLLSLICLIAIEAYGYAPWVDEFNRFTKWLKPAYLYCSLFGIIIFIGLIVIFYLYKEEINHFYKQLNSYLKSNPFTSVDLGGCLLAIPLGLISGALYITCWFPSIGFIIPLMFMFIIILSFGTLRNKICNRHTLKFLSIISMSVFLSSLVFIIGSQLGLPHLDQKYYEWSNELKGPLISNHPFDSLKCIWEFVPYFIVLIPLADIFVLIGKIPLKLPVITLSKEGQV